MDMIQILAKELGIAEQQAESAVRLIDEGNTIPFIARYRKEVTGGLDDTVLRALDERLNYLRSLQKRREEVAALIENSGKLDEKQMRQMREQLDKAQQLSEIEDLYRPYKQKKRTRASIAKEKGLEPLAQMIWEQNCSEQQLQSKVSEYVGEGKAETAQADIIAEQISDSAEIRSELRKYLQKNAVILTTKGTKENEVYSMYYEYSESIQKIAPHRILAINRGEKEEALRVTLSAEPQPCFAMMERRAYTKAVRNLRGQL